MSDKNVTTTSGETFTYGETCALAAAVYKRFGYDVVAAAAAWSRMMQNDTTPGMFGTLLNDGLSRAA